MVVVVELSIIPLGKEISTSKLLASALKELERLGVRYDITPMCTIFEAESPEKAFNAAKAAHENVFKMGVRRVVTTVKIDDRRDIERDMEEKVKSLKEAMEQ